MTTTKNTGGPVFPIPGLEAYEEFKGMTLRDWFAGQALQGMLGDSKTLSALIQVHGMEGDGTRASIAEISYLLADAMIAERSKP